MEPEIYDPEMDNLCDLLSGSTNQEIDRNAEVANYGRLLNKHIENFDTITNFEHEHLLFNIDKLFKLYSSWFIYGNPEEITTLRYDTRAKLIREHIIYFLKITNMDSEISRDKEIKHALTVARMVFIHLYFMNHEESDSEIDENDQNIFNYERPVTFYEYEIDDLVESMKL